MLDYPVQQSQEVRGGFSKMAKSQAEAAATAIMNDSGFKHMRQDGLREFLKNRFHATGFDSFSQRIVFADGSTAKERDEIEVSQVGEGDSRGVRDNRTLDQRTWKRKVLQADGPATKEKFVLEDGRAVWMDKK
jgi:hypothetical protein